MGLLKNMFKSLFEKWIETATVRNYQMTMKNVVSSG